MLLLGFGLVLELRVELGFRSGIELWLGLGFSFRVRLSVSVRVRVGFQ